MKFNIFDILNVDGDEYRITGRITYKNTEDGKCWDEYCMSALAGGGEAWLSVDEEYDEYSISRKAPAYTDTRGYHLVDQGTEIVVSTDGYVDVVRGDSALFFEYEDETEEKIISREVWDDETELSTGYYLDKDEFFFVRHDSDYKMKSNKSLSRFCYIFCAIICLYIIAPTLINMIHFTPSIRKYIEGNSSFTYVTSITGEDKQKARVYSTGSYYTVGDVAKWIISGIDGETEAVQQDTEEADGSIGILTKKEYCLVYNSEDGDVLVQVSNRKYAYTSDAQPYHSTSHIHHYYKRFYYSGGYSSDSAKYKSLSSPYSSYDGDSMSFSSSDTYSSYSSSVRQSSIYSRSSSGGGLSSGK